MLSVSIVLYKHRYKDINKLIEAINKTNIISKVFYIDNSSNSSVNEDLKKYSKSNFEYIFTGENIGFGSAHNIAIEKSIQEKYKFHLVLNPDINFDPNILSVLIDYLNYHDDIGLIMPKILFPNGNTQYLPKLLPSPFRLLFRKLPLPHKLFNYYYEYRFIKNESVGYDAPIVSGCFSLFRVNILKEIGGYDKRFFMYFEDFDLSRRINKKYRTVYLPIVSVYHEYERGANKSFNLFKIFVLSAIKYFNKWGWILDKERIKINSRALQRAKKLNKS
jgi:GT2 family glycosyltransferase